MLKFAPLAIGLLTALSIAPTPAAMAANSHPQAVPQPAANRHAQLIIKIGGGGGHSDYRHRDGEYRRREWEIERAREADRRRHEYYARRRHERERRYEEYRSIRHDRYRGEYRGEYRGDYYRH
ncbi:hypothetical protein [Chamaesiphon sp.]|uniref:hypothetical protein n=1 Tax=Chamaesiphon sp. TaxID=2814140 RepID=UPI0035937783